ncbi:MAG: PQQ-binding-like beta-propeller repeat protein, partial [Bryobacteraceae bacterium]
MWITIALAAMLSQDWPQLLGPARNGVAQHAAPGAIGAVVWRRDVGQGFAGPVVVDGKLILFHRVADNEVVECLDARNGQTVWRHAYP